MKTTKYPRAWFRRVLAEFLDPTPHNDYDSYFMCRSTTFRTVWQTPHGNAYIRALAQRFLDERGRFYNKTVIAFACLFVVLSGDNIHENFTEIRRDFLNWCARRTANRTVTTPQ